MKKLFLTLACALLAGCATSHSYVVSATSTVLGVEVGQNPANQMYHARFGYCRQELVLLPTNRSTNSAGGVNGAKETAPVILELRYSGIFSKSGGVYQRLAVGDQAVSQPGAALMFAKSRDGVLDSAAASAIASAVRGVPAAPAGEVAGLLHTLARAYRTSATPAVFDAAAYENGFPDFSAFLVSAATLEQARAVADRLQEKGALP